MGILAKLKGKATYPKVSEILNDATEATEGGQFTKIVSKDVDYYYLTDTEALIDDSPDDFRVVLSTKHDNALFIVPNKSSGFTKF